MIVYYSVYIFSFHFIVTYKTQLHCIYTYHVLNYYFMNSSYCVANCFSSIFCLTTALSSSVRKVSMVIAPAW